MVRVFLIHGMGRTSASLALLAARLRRRGHRTSTFGYLVHRTSLPRICDDFVQHIERVRMLDRDDGPHAVVGHSLGNVITRLALARLPDLRRFVMLAPPNQPPALARMLSSSSVFRALTGDAGRRLVDEAFYANLPVPTMPTLIIAGTRGPRGSWTPWHGAPGDGIVSVDEARLHDLPLVQVPCVHTFIMNDATVAMRIGAFLDDAVATGIA